MVCELVARLLKPTCEIVARVRDGRALIKAANILKESGSSSRIIFLTVHEDMDFVKACLAAGALAYVSKPRMAVDLLLAIQEVLEGRSFVSPMTSKAAT